MARHSGLRSGAGAAGGRLAHLAAALGDAHLRQVPQLLGGEVHQLLLVQVEGAAGGAGGAVLQVDHLHLAQGLALDR